ncbi:gliding motility-associated C-terminal domain-containing protein [Aquimarina hainanensis]|uniref:Gliding motility-associated C-terminal domain-containing protein n=1 Tax=Aquimarina hainanensis TaxID=1578017 RepID=A0ABW5ND21_9FLAO
MKKTTYLLIVFLGLLYPKFVSAQCEVEETFSVCDMETVDHDTNGTPDGIINLFDEFQNVTGQSLTGGTWSIVPKYASNLNPVTGEVNVWAFPNSTVTDTLEEYVFEFNTPACGDTPAVIFTMILGPFSGVALPLGANNANIEICDTDTLNLFEALTSNESIPAPHLNGTWEFISNSSGAAFTGTFTLNDHSFSADIPYEITIPPINREIFELRYVVPGMTPCATSEETRVRVSVVRQVSAGIMEAGLICEGDILAGLHDADIDLRDDQFLRDEDVGGTWSSQGADPTNQISDEQDSVINLREIYDNVINGGNNLRFGCVDFGFTYSVKKRSAVCEDDDETVFFTFFEQLRPFNQAGEIPEVCANEEPGSIDLFDLLEFTNENGIDFIYNDDAYVKWRMISGPSDLPLSEDHKGTVQTLGAASGTYVFEFGVSPKINCPGGEAFCDPFAAEGEEGHCEFPCGVLITQVTIRVLEFDYAGEDTDGINICISENQIDLRSLLKIEGGNTIVDTGVWTNEGGEEIDNTFVFPEISSPEAFRFTYTATSDMGCIDAATLEFTIHPLPVAGEDGTASVCSDNLTVTLFDHLEGNPDTTGIWTGPNGYTSTDHLGRFDQNDDTLPILGAGRFRYEVPGNAGCLDSDASFVDVIIIEPENIGNDRAETFCKIDGRVNLFSLLDRNTVRTGTFEDTDDTGALNSEGVVEFETLTNGIYNFRYIISNTAPCEESSLNVAIQIVDLPEPQVGDQEFCILDAARLEDIVVDVLNYNWYETLEGTIPIITNPILLDEQVFYIANVDANNCESERVEVRINILNIGERSAQGELCTLDFQDGVSPNNDVINDTFDLVIEDVYNIPEAFPDFDLKIFNRYGSMVYEGNADTEEFRGESNISLRLGDDLPSGTYFYIFTPNFENNFPIQGSFYLSR